MKIAVNCRLLKKNKLDGIGWFTLETLKRMVKNHPEDEFFFIFDQAYDESFVLGENVTPVVVFPPTRHRWLMHLFFEWNLPRKLKKINPDLVLHPDGWQSLKSNYPSVSVIHDLNFEHNINYIHPSYRNYYKNNFPKFTRKATRIATVSEFSKNDIHQQYGIEKDKIDVVYNGVQAQYQPLPPDDKLVIQAEIAEGSPYFVFVGSLHERKNIVNLLKAFEHYKTNNVNDCKLVFAGTKMWWTKEMQNTLEQMVFKDEVVFTDRISSQKMHCILGGALALTYVSFFEGFGIPILEAFACNVPVITSNCTSMPEVAGDAAILVNPNEVKEISFAMKKIYQQENFKKELIEKGRVQLKHFSWDKTAKLLYVCMQKAVNKS